MQPGSNILFRAATADDVETLRAVEYAAAQRFVTVGLTGIAAARPLDAALLRERIAASQVIVALDAARCVGFVMFAPLGNRFHIEELDVLQQWAGRRIGASLLEQAAARARQCGASALVLSTFRDVGWNAPYYRRLGFRNIEVADLDPALRAIREAHLARGFDESKRVFMVRPLDADQANSPLNGGGR
jgi:predicted N-acetyltransferase YhbS